jgi:hypothetical protein
MAGFSTVDAVVNALTVNLKGQRLYFHKVAQSATVANIPHSLWDANGIPIAGTYGSTGKAYGRTLTDASVGGVAFTNATAPATMHLLQGEFATMTTNATGTLILVDRIADCALAHGEATGSITGLSATTRLPSAGATAEACQIWCEVTSGFSAGSNTITYTYTNQNGTGSKTTPSIVTTASAVARRSINGNLWQPLASGDTGVRSNESVTLSSGSATGTYCLCLVRPLGQIPINATSVASARDFIVEIPSLPRIYDDSCLSLIYVPTAAVTPTVFGTMTIAEN